MKKIRVPYIPWVGEQEWLDRQRDQNARRKAEFVEFMKDNPEAKCIGCKKPMTTLGEGRIVIDQYQGPQPRCLPCQRNCR